LAVSLFLISAHWLSFSSLALLSFDKLFIFLSCHWLSFFSWLSAHWRIPWYLLLLRLLSHWLFSRSLPHLPLAVPCSLPSIPSSLSLLLLDVALHILLSSHSMFLVLRLFSYWLFLVSLPPPPPPATNPPTPQSTDICRDRAASGVFQNIDPPPPSLPSECVLPPPQQDARHRIGLSQYNLSTQLLLQEI
jgi:hypothetical protein